MTGLLRLTNLLEDGAALLGNYPLQPLSAANGSTCSPSCLCMSPACPQNVPCLSLMCLLCVPSVGPSFAPRHILCHPSPNPGPIMTGHPLHASHGIKDFTHHRPQSQIHCPATCTRDCQNSLFMRQSNSLFRRLSNSLFGRLFNSLHRGQQKSCTLQSTKVASMFALVGGVISVIASCHGKEALKNPDEASIATL